jgi:hypothetical protein
MEVPRRSLGDLRFDQEGGQGNAVGEPGSPGRTTLRITQRSQRSGRVVDGKILSTETTWNEPSETSAVIARLYTVTAILIPRPVRFVEGRCGAGAHSSRR